MHLGADKPPQGSATGGGEVRPAAADGPVLVVGDSLSVGIEPYLGQELGGRPVTIDAKTGRPSPVGVEVLRSLISPEHEVVVFDLGTNDDPALPEVLAGDLESAKALAAGRCLVIATINRPPLNGVSDEGLNLAVERFAARNPEVEVVDWRGAVAADPSLLAPDGVHAVPEGYALRAGLFAQAIDACGLDDVPAAPAAAPQPKPKPEPAQPKPPPQHAEGRDAPPSLFVLLGRALAFLGGLLGLSASG
jgi:hypothetical protein